MSLPRTGHLSGKDPRTRNRNPIITGGHRGEIEDSRGVVHRPTQCRTTGTWGQRGHQTRRTRWNRAGGDRDGTTDRPWFWRERNLSSGHAAFRQNERGSWQADDPWEITRGPNLKCDFSDRAEHLEEANRGVRSSGVIGLIAIIGIYSRHLSASIHTGTSTKIVSHTVFWAVTKHLRWCASPVKFGYTSGPYRGRERCSANTNDLDTDINWERSRHTVDNEFGAKVDPRDR